MAAEVPEAVSLELGEWVSLFPVVLDGGRLLRRDPVLNRLYVGARVCAGMSTRPSYKPSLSQGGHSILFIIGGRSRLNS